MSPHFHEHHDTYATILIVPEQNESNRMLVCLIKDNMRRKSAIIQGEQDPGRNVPDLFMVKISFFCYTNTY